MKHVFLAVAVLALGILACRMTPAEPRKLDLYPTETPNASQTPALVVITGTPVPTYTPALVVVTATEGAPNAVCVNALVAVYLRPSANEFGYPIEPLPNGTELVDLGGRYNGFVFVALGEKQGWVYEEYVGDCGVQ